MPRRDPVLASGWDDVGLLRRLVGNRATSPQRFRIEICLFDDGEPKLTFRLPYTNGKSLAGCYGLAVTKRAWRVRSEWVVARCCLRIRWRSAERTLTR